MITRGLGYVANCQKLGGWNHAATDELLAEGHELEALGHSFFCHIGTRPVDCVDNSFKLQSGERLSNGFSADAKSISELPFPLYRGVRALRSKLCL